MFRRDGLVELSTPECWTLLRANQHHVGRVAFDEGATVDGVRLTILPVNYIVDLDRVVFRTAPGAKLEQAVANRPMAFSVDSAASTQSRAPHAWSVLVRGTAHVVEDDDERRFLALSQLDPDAGGIRPSFVAIEVEEITGRRF